VPALPTLTITAEQAERCIAAYGSVAAYKQWLREQVAGHVLAVERGAAIAGLREQMLAAQAIVDTSPDPLDGAQ
jgi:hypothetical protein